MWICYRIQNLFNSLQEHKNLYQVTSSLGMKIMMDSQAAASKNFPSKRVGRSQNRQALWIGKWPVCLEHIAKQVGSKDDILFPS